MKVAAIVPAYNEKDRISTVLQAIKQAATIDEIVVVSDGSTDGTYELAAADIAVKAIKLDENKGKAGAMRVGALNTSAEVILFLDADLVGMDGGKIDAIVKPVIQNDADMSIGIFRGGRGATDLAQLLAPYISGQRAMRREDFLNIPGLDDARSGVETAITKYYSIKKLRVARVTLEGCTHCMKEEKLGYFKGFVARMQMYADIFKTILDKSDFK